MSTISWRIGRRAPSEPAARAAANSDEVDASRTARGTSVIFRVVAATADDSGVDPGIDRSTRGSAVSGTTTPHAEGVGSVGDRDAGAASSMARERAGFQQPGDRRDCRRWWGLLSAR